MSSIRACGSQERLPKDQMTTLGPERLGKVRRTLTTESGDCFLDLYVKLMQRILELKRTQGVI